MTGASMPTGGGPRRTRAALALRELLLVIALLTVAFGLMVSLARRVRSEAAYSLVQQELLELEDALAQYRRRYARLPDVPSLIPPVNPINTGAGGGPTPSAASAAGSTALVTKLEPRHEDLLRNAARVQNRALIKALGVGIEESAAEALGGVSSMMFDGLTLLDPWGRPIAYLPAGRAEIGTAAGDAPFFFSAGPDGLYLTREDNIYSYEALAAIPLDDASPDESFDEEP